MSVIGHNKGPSMALGRGWRTHCWRRARKELLPSLPLEVVRLRVNRAKALGLPYQTYASVRAVSGHDIVAFLFSSNALRLQGNAAALPIAEAQMLQSQASVARAVACQPPLAPEAAAQILAVTGAPFDTAFAAPGFGDTWSDTRRQIVAGLAPLARPKKGTVLIYQTTIEQDWAAVVRLGGAIAADQIFGP